MAERIYRTQQNGLLDRIAWKKYGVSSPSAEMLCDNNYRITDRPFLMDAGVDVVLPEQDSPPLREIIRLWD